MKKLCIAAICIFCIACTVNALDDLSNTIKLGKEVVNLDNHICYIDDKAYIPVRELFEKLRIPVLWDANTETVQIDIDHKKIHVSEKTFLKDEGVIPDKETAYKIGKITLERYCGESLEYETNDKIFFLTVKYQEDYNSWRISQNFKYKDPGVHGGVSGVYVPEVILNKNTGEVISINTYSEIQ